MKILFKKKTILVNPPPVKFRNNIPIEIIFITDKKTSDYTIQLLAKKFPETTFVLGSSISKFKMQSWSKIFSASQSKYHSINEKGYFEINANL